MRTWGRRLLVCVAILGLAGIAVPDEESPGLEAEGRAGFLAGDLARAEHAWRRRLVDAETRADAPGMAEAHRDLALVHRARGAYAAALRALDRSVELRRGLGDLLGAAHDEGLAADVYLEMGDAWKADAIQTRALASFEGGEPNVAWAAALRRLGAIRARRLLEDDALDLLESALEMSREVGDVGGAIAALVAAGDVHTALGEYDDAIVRHEGALALATEVADRAGIARALGGIAAVYREKGDSRRALEFQERALALLVEDGDERQRVSSLVTLGLTHLSRGDGAAARELYEQARERAEAMHAEDLLVRAWWGRARAHLMRGERRDAAEAARRAIAGLPAVLGALSEEQGAAARAEHGGVFEIGATAAAGLGDTSLLAFFLESGRAGTLLEFLGEREALQGAPVRPELLREEEDARRQESAALRTYREVLEGGGRRRIRRARAALDVARERLKGVIERIQREAKARVGSLVAPPLSLAQLQSSLREGDALLLYGLHQAGALALVVEPHVARLVRLGETAAFEKAYRRLNLDDAEGDPTAALAMLRKLTVTPLALPARVRRILVCPDGILSYVPFAPLVDGLDIVYVPSGTTYDLLLRERHKRGEGVLAMGDPVYGRPDETAVAGSVRSGVDLARLPFTRDEAIAVGDVVLLGSEATEAGFRFSVGKRERWRAIHIACHGVMDSEKPTLSSLALTTSGTDDGFLTALDVFRLDIPADLVVLSACDSGVGKIVNAEGVLGLMRAFLFAGSPRVVVSLGRVDDRATRALMEAFYERWRIGGSAATALREAQAHVRAQEEWGHPHYWANWVLWGLPD